MQEKTGISYCLPGIHLQSDRPFPSFCDFQGVGNADALQVKLRMGSTALHTADAVLLMHHHGMKVFALEDGWLYSLDGKEHCRLRASGDYREMTLFAAEGAEEKELLSLLRPALECAAADRNVFSLHSACVVLDGRAICFSAPSGTGKSTRAQSWVRALGARMISGDRPLIRVHADGAEASGAPWDGKEQLCLNESAPLAAICDIRRCGRTSVRRLSKKQARRVLMRQCFLPMWDTGAAAAVMSSIALVCESVPVYRVLCGPDEAAARKLWDILCHHPEEILETEKEMKIKSGFTLRSVAGENMVMPVGQNISRFDGALILNEVAAFLWRKLEAGASRTELLEYILAEYDVEQQQAEHDLDMLLDRLRAYEVLEEED